MRCLSPSTTLGQLQIVRDPLVGSASVVVGPVLGVGPFVIGRGAQDVEVAVEVDVDLAAIVLDDLDLIIALFVADLGARNAAPVSWSSAMLFALSMLDPVG